MVNSKRNGGFTLIEVLVFIIVTSILMTVVLFGATTALRQTPATHQQWVALETARGCMEWFLNQRRARGYTFLSCPSSSTPSACAAPSGYSISSSITCTSYGGDSNYKTITVSVTGLSAASLSAQIGSYY